VFVVICSLTGGSVLAWIMLNIPIGWFWAYLVHLNFYFILGIVTDNKDQMLP
jgi:hypothetical protein